MKEQRGIYNVTFNAKKATALRTDLETIEYGLAKYLNEKAILFSKGYHNIRTEDKVKEEGLIPPLSPFDNVIISFYSDRNATNKMLYKNPKVQDYYAKQQSQKAGGDTLGAQSQTKIRRR